MAPERRARLEEGLEEKLGYRGRQHGRTAGPERKVGLGKSFENGVKTCKRLGKLVIGRRCRLKGKGKIEGPAGRNLYLETVPERRGQLGIRRLLKQTWEKILQGRSSEGQQLGRSWVSMEKAIAVTE